MDKHDSDPSNIYTRWASTWWAWLVIPFPIVLVIKLTGRGLEGPALLAWKDRVGFPGIFYTIALFIASATVKHFRFRSEYPTPILDRMQDCVVAHLLGFLASVVFCMYAL